MAQAKTSLAITQAHFFSNFLPEKILGLPKRIVEKKIEKCKKGDEITRFDGTFLPAVLPTHDNMVKKNFIQCSRDSFIREIFLQDLNSRPVLRIRDVYPGSQIPDPDFYPSRIPDLESRIPDPKTGRKERGEKKFVVKHFYVATNFYKM